MKEPQWQLGRIKAEENSYSEFGHLNGQCVWVRAIPPTHEVAVDLHGDVQAMPWYTSNLGSWVGFHVCVFLGADIIELLPYFLYDDPPTIPYETWSRPSYCSDIHLEHLQ